MESKVIDKEKYSNCVKIEVEYKGETQRFGFSPEQIKNGKWKKHVEQWEEKLEEMNDINLEEI